jgi:carbon monoxide dehydrogenase subunit G
MASLYADATVAAPPDEVWAAIRDVGSVHQRLAPGFVVATRLEPGARVVTFGSGAEVRELIVSVDDERRRLVWAAVDGPVRPAHHNASMQVFPESAGGSRIVWIADVLPDELAEPIGKLMQQGCATMTKTFQQRV